MKQAKGPELQLTTSDKVTMGGNETTSLQTKQEQVTKINGGLVIDSNFETNQLDNIAKISRISLKQAIKERKYTKSQELKHRMPRKRYYNGVGKIMVNDVSIRQQKLENIPFKKLASRNDVGSVSCKIASKKVQSGVTIAHQRQLSLNQQFNNQQLAFDFKDQENSKFSSNRNWRPAGPGLVEQGPDRQNQSSLTNDGRGNQMTIVTPDIVLSGQQLLSIGNQQSTNLSEFTQDPYTHQYKMPQKTRNNFADEGIFASQQERFANKESKIVFSSDKPRWGQRFSGRHQTQQNTQYNLGIDLEMFRRKTVMLQAGNAEEEGRQPRGPFQSATAHHTFRNLNELPLLEEAAVSHMMEKMDYPRIKFSLQDQRGSYNASDRISDHNSANTWLQQRQKEQDYQNQQINDRIIMKRLNQLYPEPLQQASSNLQDEDFLDNQLLVSASKIKSGIDVVSAVDPAADKAFDGKYSRQQTVGIYSGRNHTGRQNGMLDGPELSPSKQYSQVPSKVPVEILSDQNSILGGIIKSKDGTILQDYEDSRSPARPESYQIKQRPFSKDRFNSRMRDSDSARHGSNLLAAGQQAYIVANNKQGQQQSRGLKKVFSLGMRSSQVDSATHPEYEGDQDTVAKLQQGVSTMTGQLSELGKKQQENNYLLSPDDDLIAFSSGNMYNAKTNPQVKKFVNQIAGFLENTDSQVAIKKEHMSKINLMMKQSKNAYIQTLLDGEEKKHCTGIQKRFMETKYNVRQHQQLQPEEDEVSIKKEQKKQRDKEKILQRQKRAFMRMENFWRCQTIGSSMPLQVPNSLIPNQEDISNPAVLSFAQSQTRPCVLHNQSDARTDKGDIEDDRRTSYIPKVNVQEGQNLIQTEEQAVSADKRRMTVAPGSVHMNLKLIAVDRQQAKLRGESMPNNPTPGKKRADKFMIRTQTYNACDIAVNFLDKQKETASLNIQQKKAQNQLLNKRLKVFRDAFCIQKIPAPYDMEIEELYKADVQNHNKPKVVENLNIFFKHLSTEKFERQRPLTNKKIQTQYKPKALILSAEDLGLEKQKEFKELSQFLFRGSNFGRLDHREFSKQAFREHLNDRYSKLITDRIMLVLESQNMIKPQMSEMDYAQMICDMLNLGPEFYKKMLFACLSKLNPGRICEHDIFSLLQTFKQIDSFYFYRELINRKEVPRDFKDLKDNSDQIFFEAFAPDIIEISHTMSIRKRLLGIFDNDKEKNFMNDIQETTFETYEEYEEEVVRQIEYTASIISKTYASKNSLIVNVLDILTNERDLLKIRAKFIQLVIDHKILNISKKKQQQDTSEQKNPKQLNVQTLFKPPSNINPCIGADCGRPGSRISNCIYMNYDDFMKLIDFPADTVSSFMDDFIDHLTAGCVSLKHFEEHLGKYREYERENREKKPQADQKNYLEGTTVIDYLEKKNLEVYGNSQGEPSYSIQAKRSRQGKSERKITTHIIDHPFILQDHMINGEFCGKMLMQQNQNNNTTAKEKMKSSAKVKRRVQLVEGQESSDDSEIENYRKPSGKNMVVHIGEEQIHELEELRKHFGDPHFFKIFRIFYQLAVVPEDAQNNPFLLFLDKESVIRNFKKVFGDGNEEVAIRFYCLLMRVKQMPKEDNKKGSDREIELSHRVERKKGEIDFVLFLRSVKYLCNNTNHKDNQGEYLRLAFRFLDYDDNGSIGSVDILNLRKSFNQELVDKIALQFEKEQIKKTFAKRMFALHEQAAVKKKMQKNFMMTFVKKKTNIGLLKGIGGAGAPTSGSPSANVLADQQTKSEKKKAYKSVYRRKYNNEDEVCQSAESDNENDKEPDTYRGISPEVQRILSDPWNRFLLEVAQLRDYFVENAIHSHRNSDDVKDQKFLTLHNYQHNFLQNFARKYDLKTPTITHFFKSKFEYASDVRIPKEPEAVECYRGFDPVQDKGVTDALIQMQETLDKVATSVRFAQQGQ